MKTIKEVRAREKQDVNVKFQCSFKNNSSEGKGCYKNKFPCETN